MSTKIAWIALAVETAICGILCSVHILGHHRSEAGWFDLRGLDPLVFLIQDAILATIFTAGGLLTAGAALLILHRTKCPNWLAPAIGMVAVLGVTFNLFQSEHEPKEEQAGVQKQDDAKYFAMMKGWNAANEAAFANLGWVKYVNQNGTPEPLQVQSSQAKFSSSDPPETVIDYYLTRADSWELGAGQLFILVHNGPYSFRIFPGFTPGSPCTIYRVEKNPAPQLANLGSAKWADIHPLSPKLNYPGAADEVVEGVSRQWTTDSMEKVSAFYQALDLRSEGQEEPNETLSGIVDGSNVTIRLNQATTPNGEGGVLIQIQS